MALRKIIEEGDPQLNKISREVSEVNERTLQLVDDLVDTMRDAGGVGLAAPQVGILRRLCVVETEPENVYVLINPVILETEGEQTGDEGCLSVPGYFGTVTRPNRVKVQALDRKGEMQTYDVEGFTARAFCHEIDHLDGILYTSKATNLEKISDQKEEKEE